MSSREGRMIMSRRYELKAYEDEDRIIPYNEYRYPPLPIPSPDSVEFEIKLRILNIVDEDGVEPVCLDPIEDILKVPRKHLIDFDEDPNRTRPGEFISAILEDIGVEPESTRKQMANTFKLSATWMAVDGRYVLCKVLPLIVEIKVVYIFRPEEDNIYENLALEIRRRREDRIHHYFSTRIRPVPQNIIEYLEQRTTPYVTRSAPASESAIQKLDEVQVGTAGSSLMNNNCVICLEELPLGSTVTRLPCSHVYHGDCILQWLHIHHKCPVCRFPLPH